MIVSWQHILGHSCVHLSSRSYKPHRHGSGGDERHAGPDRLSNYHIRFHTFPGYSELSTLVRNGRSSHIPSSKSFLHSQNYIQRAGLSVSLHSSLPLVSSSMTNRWTIEEGVLGGGICCQLKQQGLGSRIALEDLVLIYSTAAKFAMGIADRIPSFGPL